MTSFFPRGAFGAAAFAASALLLAGPSAAHVSFETAQAAPNSPYRAVLRIPHGCKGQPTLKVRVTIPEGIVAVKPMPKAGWALDTTTGPYARAYPVHGEQVSAGVREIVWTGSLEDGHYDEFVFQARITDAFQAGATVHVPVVQECAGGREEWTGIPAAGQDPHSLASPAPGIRIAASPGGGGESAAKAGALAIETPWSRATPGGAKVGGGYLRIRNTGAVSDRLIGGSLPQAGRVEVHRMVMDGTVMRMAPVEGGLEIRPGETVELKPGGLHLMFMDLKEPLKEGQSVKGSLVFEKAGRVEVTFTVSPMGGPAAGNAEHKH